MRSHSFMAVILLAPVVLAAQQNDPAVEVYALTGGYYHGNNSATQRWEPQVGVGVHAPFGRNWAAIIDFTTSETENFWDLPGLQEGTRGHVRERAFTFAPSFVRILRWRRFSFYGGGGVAVEHRRQSSSFPVLERFDEDGEPIYSDALMSRRFNRTDAALLLRGGALISLTDRTVFRADYSALPRYVDEKASQSITVGIGYRFGR